MRSHLSITLPAKQPDCRTSTPPPGFLRASSPITRITGYDTPTRMHYDVPIRVCYDDMTWVRYDRGALRNPDMGAL